MTSGPHIRSSTGATRSGSPLATSRAPTEDLRPWFYWWSIAEGSLPDGYRINCGRMNDHACLTIIYCDAWTAHTADGEQVWDPGENGLALYFGPMTQRMPLSIAGRYLAVTLHFNAGAPSVLGFPDQASMLNRIVDFDRMLGRDVPLASLVPRDQPLENWLLALEDEFRKLVHHAHAKVPDPMALAFERECLANPDFTVEEFARLQDVSKRTIERTIKKAFGITPKQALRRARALDMASSLLGVARPEDAPEMEERYFDQSHRIKEIRDFFGMSPGEMQAKPHPFLRLGLEVRQRRRLDALNELEPHELGPWRDPDSEPRSGRAD